jgi:hypothetical protein
MCISNPDAYAREPHRTFFISIVAVSKTWFPSNRKHQIVETLVQMKKSTGRELLKYSRYINTTTSEYKKFWE